MAVLSRGDMISLQTWLDSRSLPFVVLNLQSADYVAIVHLTASRCAGPTEFVKLCEGALQAECVNVWEGYGKRIRVGG